MDMSETQSLKMQDVKQINFMAHRRVAMFLSLILVVASLVGLFVKGLNFGIDFTGGTIVEVSYDRPANIEEIRSSLRAAGFEDAIVQNFGSAEEVLIRLAPQEGLNTADISNQVMDVLRAKDPYMEMRRVEFVGPQVGEELTEDGALSVIYALFGVLIYVALRFEFRFSIGAVSALIHDVVITLGIFAWLQIQFDLTVLAALLAVIGYSLNDTIVVFDRVRENFRTMREGTSEEVSNVAINQMLSRTIMTSVTTLVVLLALFIIGGEAIQYFALALIIGVIVGTYSSIYVASSIALFLGVSKEDLMKPVKEGVDGDQQEEDLNRLFLEQEAKNEAKREAKEAKEAAKAEQRALKAQKANA